MSLIKLVLAISLLSYSQSNDCPNNRTIISTPCYGECGNFIDENSNGVCDIWERYNTKKKETSLENKNTKLDTNLNNKNIKTIPNYIKPKNNVDTTKYGIVYIAVINLILIITSEITFKTSIYIRLFWNWILFISMATSIITGFMMYFKMLERSILYPLHIQSSIIVSITSLYHVIKRWKCMFIQRRF